MTAARCQREEREEEGGGEAASFNLCAHQMQGSEDIFGSRETSSGAQSEKKRGGKKYPKEMQISLKRGRLGHKGADNDRAAPVVVLNEEGRWQSLDLHNDPKRKKEEEEAQDT